ALNNSSGATDLRNGSGDQLIAKILLAMIALAVGVGGIWLLFIGVASVVSLLRAKWRDRILPWVFAGPALVLLALFLAYLAVRTADRRPVAARAARRDRGGRGGLADPGAVDPPGPRVLRARLPARAPGRFCRGRLAGTGQARVG